MEGQGNNQVLSHSHAAINTADTCTVWMYLVCGDIGTNATIS